jgi:LCP family protein required for cell wall assembly
VTPSDDDSADRRRGGGATPSGWTSDPSAPGRAVSPGRPPSGSTEPKVAPRQYFVPAGATSTRTDREPDAHRFPEAPSPSGPTPPSGPPPARRVPGPAGAPAPRPARRRRRWGPRRIALTVLVVVFALVLFFCLFMFWQFNRIERVPVADVLSTSGSGTNYLIVGSDSRDGFDPSNPNAAAVLGDGAEGSGQRSDTMLVLHVGDDGDLMTSVPRDLWVTRADGSEGRINAAYRDGPAALIQSIQQGVGIPVHHYVEVDFVTFAGLVDAVGGVTIEFPYPARDTHSGLFVQESGPVTLDGTQAIAYVRSRHYEEFVDGAWVADPTGDLGRVQRQQAFLRAVMGEVGSTRNPIELMSVASSLSDGLRIDDDMSLFDALAFARDMRGMDAESVEIPTYGYRTSDGAAVLGLVEPDADAVIARFQ